MFSNQPWLGWPLRLIEGYGVPLAGLALFLAFAAAAPNFATLANLLNIAKGTGVLGILALGFSLALLAGELDLSFAEVCSLSAVVAGAMVAAGFPPWLAVVSGTATGLAFGLVNGVLVTRLHVPSLIATLATGAIARGGAFWLTGGVAFVGRWPRDFTDLGRGQAGGVPSPVLWLLVAGAASWLLVSWTRPGAQMLATGEAPDAARLAGVDTARIRMLGLALSGGLAGVGAVLLAATLSSAAPGMAGDYFLYAVAAVLLGMTCFTPGRPNVPGTLVSALLLKVVGNGLVLLGVPYYVQDVTLGLIIAGAAALSGVAMRRAAFR